MSISKLPSGRYRAQVYDPATQRNVSVAKVLGLTGRDATFARKADAKAAREKARQQLGAAPASTVTVGAWWDTWTTDPLYRRPKANTNEHNAGCYAGAGRVTPLRVVEEETA